MYSQKIKSKVDAIFSDLKEKTVAIMNDFSTSDEAVNNITKLISSELGTRSKSIISDMLFDLSDALMETDFFTDVARQNRFSEINLRQEILKKYQFTLNTSINYKEVSRITQALKFGGATFIVGGIIEIVIVLISGLSLFCFVPISISVLIGAILVDYYVIEPIKNKKIFSQSLNIYLSEAKQQFLNLFEEVEKYFNMRVEEIKKTL